MRTIKRKLYRVLILAVSLIGTSFTITATAASIYVDNQLLTDCQGTYSIANRDSSGSDGDAYNTIQEAANIAVAGDIVFIRGGTYTGNENYIEPANSGTSDTSRITYTNYGNENVTITDAQYGVRLEDNSYVTINGINFDTIDRGIHIIRGRYNHIEYCTFNKMRTYSWFGSRIHDNSQYNRISHCTFSRWGQVVNGNDYCGVLDLGTESNAGDLSDYNLIENSTFFYGGHHVLRINSANNIIRDNYFHNEEWMPYGNELYGNRNIEVYSEHGNRNLFEGNRIAFSGLPPDDPGSTGLKICTKYNIVRFNAIYHNNVAGIHMAPLSNNEPSYNHIYHNTIYHNGYNPLYYHGGLDFCEAPATGNVIKNNIFFDNIEGIGIVFEGTARRDEQIIENNWEEEGDPFFVDETVLGPFDPSLPDFRLQETSPCIDAGAFLTTVTTTGSGTSLQVEDAGYFYDGFGIPGEVGDLIQLDGQTAMARITNVDYTTNIITVDTSLSWTNGQGISLAYEGNAPDIGAYEYVLDPNNQAPVLEAIGNKSVNENSALTFDVNASDPDGDTITYSVLNLPSGATFSIQTFSWTPSYDQAGSYQVRFIASDGNSQDSETITITVNNVNRAPVLGAISDQSVDENTLLSFSASATDPDGQTLTYSVSGLPSGAAFASQTFTWTPSYDQAGAYPVTFTADDGQAQDSQTITISVINVNRAPVLTAIGNRTAYADVLLTFTIDATDPDGDAITYSVGTLPSGATFTGQDFDWTPSQSQGGSYAVTFIASDGQLQDSETVTITVGVDSLAPTVTNLSPTAGSIQVPLNNLITLNITDAGIGVDADSVKIKVRVSNNPNINTVYFGDTDNYTSPYGDCRRLGTKADYRFVYQPTNEMLYYDQTVTITVNATDLAGNVMDEYSYSFATEMHSFGQNKQVNSGLDNNDRPVTVYDSSGNIWTAWHVGPIDNRDIYISKLAAGEENFSGTVQLTDNTTDQCNPAIALDSNDKLYVVWQDNREGEWDIYISTSVDGISWSTETRVNDPNDGNQVNPAIVIDGQNNAHVVWQDDLAGNQDIFIATSSDGFATPTVSQQITFDNFDQVEPAVAADSDNTIYVVWTDGRNGSNDIYGAASNNPWTNVAIVSNTNNQSSPAIAAESIGSILHLLWVDDTSGDNDIYYASSDGLPGSPLTGSSIIDDSYGADQLDPTIAVTGSTDNNLKVFACWQDWRNTDTDLYFAELSTGSGTNVFVGDGGSNADQGKPVIGIDEYSHPYLIWADSRSTDTDIYYTGSTFIEPTALASELVTASASNSTIVGTDPQAITTVDDVSILVPAGACSYDVVITVTKIANLPAFPAPCLGGYDFGPSGIQFSQPVTITIPYVFSGSNSSVTPYWFNSMTGALSQQGITDIQDIPISSSLHALSFKTTHFTAFYLLEGGGAAATIVRGGGGGGGCSVSASGEGNIVEYILPYIALAVVMAILKMRDARDRKARNMTAGKC